jgi:citrate lyase gamma subunit
MEIKENLVVMNEISLPLPSSVDLRGRQSVRATFKLSAKAIDTLSLVAVHLGIKQKVVTAEFKGAIEALIEARTHIGTFIVKGQIIENFNA